MIAEYKNGKIVYRYETKEEIAEREAWERAHPEERVDTEPTAEERMEAQVLYTALMTDTLLEV